MHRRIRQVSFSLMLIAVVCGGGWQLQQRLSLAHAQVSATLAVAQQVADATNRGDLAALQALLSEDVVFVGGAGCFPTACLGKPAVMQELASEIAGHLTVTNTSLAAEGNIVSGRSEIREDAIRTLGMERILEANLIVVRGGQVAALVTTPDTTDPQTQQFLAAVSGSPPLAH